MLDDNLYPYLIEVNHAPSFATESGLDLRLKTKLLQDSFRLLNMSVSKKAKFKKERNKINQNRMVTGRKEVVSQEERDHKRRVFNITRHNFEVSNLGDFELIYPLVDENNHIIGNHQSDYLQSLGVRNLSKLESKKHSQDLVVDMSNSRLETATQSSIPNRESECDVNFGPIDK